jgi:hypothetical protein
MAFVGRRRVGCGALRTPTITEEECGRGVRPGEDAASAFLGAAASVAAPSALQPSPRRSAAAASGPAKTLPLPPRRQKGLAPVPESCLQLDARPAPALYNPAIGGLEDQYSLKSHVGRGMTGPPEAMSIDVGDPGLFGGIGEVRVMPGCRNTMPHRVKARARLREDLGVAARTFPGRMKS